MKSDIRELARELAEACDDAWSDFHCRTNRHLPATYQVVFPIIEPILAKHFPAEPQPVAMEVVVERIAEHATKTAEALNRGHYMPSMTECLAPLIRAELAPVETLLDDIRKEQPVRNALQPLTLLRINTILGGTHGTDQ